MFDLSRSLSIPGPVVALLALCWIPGLAGAQQGDEVFVDTVDVDVVNVEVIVTDSEDNPVRDLTRDDFVVREDGQPVEITNFYAVEGARRVPAEGEAPERVPVEALAPLPRDQRLNLVVLIDNVNISPGARSRVVGEIEKELGELLRPGDRVLVAAIDPDVRVLRTFTEEPAAIAAALDRLELTASRGDVLQADRRLIRRQIDEAAGSLAAGGLLRAGERSAALTCGMTPQDCGRFTLSMVRSWIAEVHLLNRRLLDTLEGFVQALSGLPGRRAVLHVSEGFHVRPGEGLMEEWFEVFAPWAREIGVQSPESEAARWDASSELIALTGVAAANRVVFYTLEAGGVFHDDLDPATRHIGSPSRSSDVSGRGGLSELAWRTGGISLLDSGNVGLLLDRIAADFRDYYSLGYASPRSNDGAYHRIEVEIPGRRVRTRHTEGYRAATPAQQTVDQTLATLVFDLGSNPLDVQVELGREQSEKGGRYVVPVLVRIPIASLALIPGDKTYRGKVSIVVAVQDTHGRLSSPQRVDLPVEIPTKQLRDALDLQVAKGINLMVREGESKLAVGVRDELGGTSSTVNVTLSAGGEK